MWVFFMSNLTSRKEKKKNHPSLMSLLMNFSLKRGRWLYTEGGVEGDKLRPQRVKGQWTMSNPALSAEPGRLGALGAFSFQKTDI